MLPTNGSLPSEADSRINPVPASRINLGTASPSEIATHDVEPPYRRNAASATGVDPRTP